MAEGDPQVEEGGAEGEEAPVPKNRFKIILIAVAGLLVVSGAGGYFFFFKGHKDEKMAEAPPPKPPVFMDVPELLVNLSSQPGERVQYLKMKIVLEVKEQPVVALITPSMPRLTDIFQTYLRELRASDLQGSAGIFRLKEELTRRVNVAIAPTQVNAVLFKEIVVQ
ncbi:MAG: flagellar basal body-associated protein FliL [Proteobacteria bacterium SG_bin9]|nr:MAG: flagellar basal body-associated protein FliL [Proteobacteria bacterium SG_bin9]